MEDTLKPFRAYTTYEAVQKMIKFFKKIDLAYNAAIIATINTSADNLKFSAILADNFTTVTASLDVFFENDEDYFWNHEYTFSLDFTSFAKFVKSQKNVPDFPILRGETAKDLIFDFSFPAESNTISVAISRPCSSDDAFTFESKYSLSQLKYQRTDEEDSFIIPASMINYIARYTLDTVKKNSTKSIEDRYNAVCVRFGKGKIQAATTDTVQLTIIDTPDSIRTSERDIFLSPQYIKVLYILGMTDVICVNSSSQRLYINCTDANEVYSLCSERNISYRVSHPKMQFKTPDYSGALPPEPCEMEIMFNRKKLLRCLPNYREENTTAFLLLNTKTHTSIFLKNATVQKEYDRYVRDMIEISFPYNQLYNAIKLMKTDWVSLEFHGRNKPLIIKPVVNGEPYGGLLRAIMPKLD